MAEGVETQDQVEHLRRLGCSVGQGYHLGRPCPADEMTALLLGGLDQKVKTAT